MYITDIYTMLGFLVHRLQTNNFLLDLKVTGYLHNVA